MCTRTTPSFHDKGLLLDQVDGLPTQTEFFCETLTLTGDLETPDGKPAMEEIKVCYRNPVDVICEIIGNLDF